MTVGVVRWWMLGWWARYYVAKAGWRWLDWRGYQPGDRVGPSALDRIALGCTNWQWYEPSVSLRRAIRAAFRLSHRQFV